MPGDQVTVRLDMASRWTRAAGVASQIVVGGAAWLRVGPLRNVQRRGLRTEDAGGRQEREGGGRTTGRTDGHLDKEIEGGFDGWRNENEERGVGASATSRTEVHFWSTNATAKQDENNARRCPA